MTPAEVLDQARATGVTLWAEGDALRYRGPREALAKLLPALKAHKPAILAALALPGVSPEFAARLDAEDLKDIAAGAREVEDLREAFEERAGILEHDAGLPRAEAELEAAKITATYARNCGYQWASLRSALSAYPEILASLPEKVGSVDSLPLGVAKLAVFPGKPVVRQGAFTGAHEVCR